MEQTLTAMDVSDFDWRGDHAGKLAGEGWDASSKVGAPGNESDPNHNASGFSAFPAGFLTPVFLRLFIWDDMLTFGVQLRMFTIPHGAATCFSTKRV